ncbi:pyridoxamine 5'-phosphate oxidase family protein [Devosia sediminis]|uniref:Pyridoxamine 5'-phosphate oxidase family protein n=1 Tax=Devosia sediminis TaxID=2798801 RepID=A0A934IQQ9_9HYPH|nr:pyridoxamine 5'-phosphate oxidase family protein [Devosia sediminis]MBJ3783456.1 pyridoxamine 5'-phosphate oxidase family protein [Devosia sediminis]
MTEQNNNILSTEEAIDRIWDLAKKIDICMLTTWDGEQQRSRPMSARVRREEHAIYFLTDLEGHKLTEIDNYPHVSLAWADNGGHKYVVIAGEAEVSNDRAKIADLWSDFDKAWWDDANDPQIRLLRVVPEDGEVWDSPNMIVTGAKMLVAAVTGAKTDMGDTGKARL